jgi:Uma2 family endonuclease
MLVRIRHPEKLIYPESDGQPMGENTLQFQWILTLFHGFEGLFFERPDVFVAGDLFWYPVHRDPTTVQAPDLMVVFGRPKGHRGSYKQWEEGDVAPQVVFEITSPGNTPKERATKRKFYTRYGVEEFYEYDPDHEQLSVWIRSGKSLLETKNPSGFLSPRLGVRFELPDEGSLHVIRPDGRPFLTYSEMITAAELQQRRVLEEQRRADDERKRAEVAQQRADEAARRAEALAAKLRELGVDPDRV